MKFIRRPVWTKISVILSQKSPKLSCSLEYKSKIIYLYSLFWNVALICFTSKAAPPDSVEVEEQWRLLHAPFSKKEVLFAFPWAFSPLLCLIISKTLKVLHLAKHCSWIRLNWLKSYQIDFVQNFHWISSVVHQFISFNGDLGITNGSPVVKFKAAYHRPHELLQSAWTGTAGRIQPAALEIGTRDQELMQHLIFALDDSDATVSHRLFPHSFSNVAPWILRRP